MQRILVGRVTRAVLLASVAAAIPLAQPAIAQTSDAEAASGEIVVTARRTEERLQDVPLAVSALAGNALKDTGVTNLEGLNSRVPNLNVKAGNTDPGAAVFSIRGQSVPNQLLTVDNAVGVYQDNVNNPRAYGLLGAGLLDVQRVEVLRGPQGTLYGRNTTGGAVSIYTQDPKPELGASVQLTGGNFDHLEAVGILNLPLSENAGLRFVAQHGSHDPYHHSRGPRAGTDRPAREKSSYFRGKFVGEFGDLRVGFTGDYFHYNAGGAAFRLSGLYDPTLYDADPDNNGTNLGANAARQVALEMGLDPNNPAQLAAARSVLLGYVGKGGFYDTFNNSPLRSVNKGGSLALNLDWNVSPDITLRSITGYRWLSRDTQNDLDGTPYTIFANDFGTRDKFFSQEVQLLGAMGDFSWVAGLYYSNEWGREFSDQVNTVLITPTRTFNNGKVVSKSYAAFAQVNWSITDRLRLTGGIRYTREQKNLRNENAASTGCSVAPILLDEPGVCAATFKNRFSDPSWLVSADYKISGDVLVYAKATRGFRGGGQNLRARGTNLALYTPFGPETVTEYEAGLKSELFDKRLLFNVAAFSDDYSGAQRSVTLLINGTNSTIVTNAAKARLQGIEVESTLRIVDGFSINGSLGYLHTKYLKFEDISGDRTNEPFPVPKWNYTIGANFSQQIGAARVLANVNYAWQSRQDLQPQSRETDQTSLPAYGLLNGRIGVEFEDLGLEVSVFGRNLTKKRYDAAFITLESLGFNTAQPGTPRVVGVQIIKSFGSEKR